jgi:hypothetical protein
MNVLLAHARPQLSPRANVLGNAVEDQAPEDFSARHPRAQSAILPRVPGFQACLQISGGQTWLHLPEARQHPRSALLPTVSGFSGAERLSRVAEALRVQTASRGRDWMLTRRR